MGCLPSPFTYPPPPLSRRLLVCTPREADAKLCHIFAQQGHYPSRFKGMSAYFCLSHIHNNYLRSLLTFVLTVMHFPLENKLENFLFRDVNADSELVMIDFGLSKHFTFGEVHHEAVGTPYTVAPEVIRGRYDERCDVWAIGE